MRRKRKGRKSYGKRKRKGYKGTYHYGIHRGGKRI
jgi:hypothetical protein